MSTQRHPMDLAGRTILVTGASSGIGRETAVVLSELGCRVILNGRNHQQLEATLLRTGRNCNAIEAFDLTMLEDIPAWVKGIVDRQGPLHGIIHAAGFRKTISLRGLSLDALHQMFRLNLDSSIILAKAFMQKGCREANSGLVFVSSVAAFAGAPGIAAYAASKAALIGLTKSVAIELAPMGVRVNCIAPGLVESEMTDQIRRTLSDEQFSNLVSQYPLGLGKPRDVAFAAAYLLSDAARWMTGHTLVLDGGFSAQ